MAKALLKTTVYRGVMLKEIMNKENKSSYLNAGRLADVLSLIQVLAYDKYTSRSENGISKELKSKPESAATWIELAQSHPEFFRVRFEVSEKLDDSESKEEETAVNRASLISRYVLPHEIIEGKKIRPQLEPNVVNKIMEIAISIHDRQLSRTEKWKYILPALSPLAGAIVGASAVIISVLIKS